MADQRYGPVHTDKSGIIWQEDSVIARHTDSTASANRIARPGTTTMPSWPHWRPSRSGQIQTLMKSHSTAAPLSRNGKTLRRALCESATTPAPPSQRLLKEKTNAH